MAKYDVLIAEMGKDIKTLILSVNDLKMDFQKSCEGYDERLRSAEGKVGICETNLNTAGQEITRLRGTQNTYSLLNIIGAAIMAAGAGLVGWFKQ